MNATLLELTAGIVSSHAGANEMTSEELVQEINKVYVALKKLESGEALTSSGAPVMTLKQAFQKDQVCCMVCGKTGFKTLTRHLKQAHDLKPGQYRKQFNIPASQSLTAKNYSESRRAAADQSNLAVNLEKARAARAEKRNATKLQEQAAAAKPAKKAKPAAAPKSADKAPKAAAAKKTGAASKKA